jgi:hypothetical protein
MRPRFGDDLEDGNLVLGEQKPVFGQGSGGRSAGSADIVASLRSRRASEGGGGRGGGGGGGGGGGHWRPGDPPAQNQK